jgi:hypothetical protein
MYSLKCHVQNFKIVKNNIWKKIWNTSLGLDPDAEISIDTIPYETQEVCTGKFQHAMLGGGGGSNRSLNIFFLNDVFGSESLQKMSDLTHFQP